MNISRVKSFVWMFKAWVIGRWVNVLRPLKVTHSYLNRLETVLWTECKIGMPYKHSLVTAASFPEPMDRGKGVGEKQLIWDALVDKRYFARHLTPRKEQGDDRALPEAAELLELFRRPIDPVTSEELVKRGRGNLLFIAFAQWLTDGVFRSDYKDKRKTTSSHQIDLAQVYGGSSEETSALRANAKDGKLFLDDKHLPPKLYKDSNGTTDYSSLSYVGKEIEASITRLSELTKQSKEANSMSMRATGLKTGTLSIGNFLITTLFVREHNRVCDLLKEEYPGLTGDELFNYARNITTVRALQIILKDYIGFITDKDHYRLDPSLSEKIRSQGGWLPIEFNLLYRWHSAVPAELRVSKDKTIDWRTGIAELDQLDFNQLVGAAINQASGDIALKNSPEFLIEAERNMIEMGRKWNLKSYADYCRAFDFPVAKDFKKLTKDPTLAQELSGLYGEGNVEDLDFVVGIFAEKKFEHCVLGGLLMRIVAYEAFTNIYNNPLLAKGNYNERAFTKKGMLWLKEEFSIDDLVRFNTKLDDDLGMDLYFKNQKLGFHPLKYSCQHSKYVDSTVKQAQIHQTLCPVLRVGIKSGEISLDNEGWAYSRDLKDYMGNIGFKRESMIVNNIVCLAARATGNKLIKRQVNVTGFKGTFQDHGSSSRVLHSENDVDQKRLRDFLNVVPDGALFGQQELAEAVLKFYLNAELYGGRKSKFGAFFQLLEMGSLLRIFGKKRAGDTRLTLSKDDINSIWVGNKYPEHFDSTADRPEYGSWESSLVHGQMLCYFVWAVVRDLFKSES